MPNTTSSTTINPQLIYTVFGIRTAFLPVILLGTVMNLCNLLVLSRRDMRRLSVSVYLMFLSVADLGIMYLELFRIWFELYAYWYNIVNFNNSYCQAMNYLNGVVRDFSNWLIACLTLERLIAASSVSSAKKYCRVSTARRVTVSLFIVIAAAHSHHIYFTEARKEPWYVCWERKKGPGSIIWAVVQVLVGYSVVLVVLVSNVALIIRLRFYHRGQQRQTHWARSRALTKTLVLVATVFLLCETPRTVVDIVFRLKASLRNTDRARYILNASYLLSGLNHATNFIVYILSSKRFRGHFIDSFQNLLIGLVRRCKWGSVPTRPRDLDRSVTSHGKSENHTSAAPLNARTTSGYSPSNRNQK